MTLKEQIAQRGMEHLEKQVKEMNKIPDGRKVKLTEEQKAEKKRAYHREWWAKKKGKKGKNKTVVIDNHTARELTARSLLSQDAKADAGKPQLSLVPMDILTAIACVREYGNRKYHDPDNWKTVDPKRYRDALLRHIVAYIDNPKGKDAESGLEHLWHAACNIAFLVAME